MTCPPEIAAVVTEILTRGILRVRMAGWRGDAARCALEADHMHNLPNLLQRYSPELLSYYLDCEISSFLDKVGCDPEFEPLWEQLQKFRETTLTSGTSPARPG